MQGWAGIVVAAGFVPALAFAQDAPPGGTPKDKPVGRPHHCEQFFPGNLQRSGAEGATTLAFVITHEGWMRNIKVVKSSGNAGLDWAAVTCATRWHYIPATRDRVPIATPWEAKIVWTVPPAPDPDAAQDPKPAAPKP